jgi:hypothetical protein
MLVSLLRTRTSRQCDGYQVLIPLGLYLSGLISGSILCRPENWSETFVERSQISWL